MSSNFKGISRKIKKLTKTFNQITNYIDNTWIMKIENISTDFYLWQPKFLKILSHGIQVFVIESSLKFSSILSTDFMNKPQLSIYSFLLAGGRHSVSESVQLFNCVASVCHDETSQVFITSHTTVHFPLFFSQISGSGCVARLSAAKIFVFYVRTLNKSRDSGARSPTQY